MTAAARTAKGRPALSSSMSMPRSLSTRAAMEMGSRVESSAPGIPWWRSDASAAEVHCLFAAVSPARRTQTRVVLASIPARSTRARRRRKRCERASGSRQAPSTLVRKEAQVEQPPDLSAQLDPFVSWRAGSQPLPPQHGPATAAGAGVGAGEGSRLSVGTGLGAGRTYEVALPGLGSACRLNTQTPAEITEATKTSEPRARRGRREGFCGACVLGTTGAAGQWAARCEERGGTGMLIAGCECAE